MPSLRSPALFAVSGFGHSEPARDRQSPCRPRVMLSRSGVEKRMEQLPGGRVAGNAD
jgi:hypothetical protein